MNQSQEKEVLAIARSYIGVPYKYGVKEEEVPQYLDCSYFTKLIYFHLKIDLPRSTILQAADSSGIEIPLTESAWKIGDLLFFRGAKGHYNDELFPGREIYIGHVAIYSGNGNVIHAASETGVIEEPLTNVIQKRGSVVMVKRIL